MSVVSARRSLPRVFLGLAIFLLVALVIFYRYRTGESAEWFDWQAFVLWMRSLNKQALLLALLAIYSTYILRSLRWQQLTRPIAETKMMNLLVATVIGYTGVFLLGRPAEVVRPLLIARREKLRVASMLGVTLFERVQDVLAILFWMGFGLLLMPVEPAVDGSGSALLSTAGQAGWLALAVALAVMFLLGVWRWQSEKILAWIEKVLRFLPHGLHHRISDLLHSFSEGWRAVEHTKVLLITFGYSVLIWFLVLVAYYLTCWSAGGALARISFGGITILLAMGILGSSLLIPGIGGGYQAATFVTLTTLFGAEVEVAAGVAVLLWLLTFAAVAVVGVPLMIREGLSLGELRRMSRKREETPDAF